MIAVTDEAAVASLAVLARADMRGKTAVAILPDTGDRCAASAPFDS